MICVAVDTCYMLLHNVTPALDCSEVVDGNVGLRKCG